MPEQIDTMTVEEVPPALQEQGGALIHETVQNFIGRNRANRLREPAERPQFTVPHDINYFGGSGTPADTRIARDNAEDERWAAVAPRFAVDRNGVEDQMLRLRDVYTVQEQLRDNVYVARPNGYTAYVDGNGRIGYTTAEMPQNIEETERQSGQLERNHHGEPIVEVDLVGTVMTQNILDDVYSRVSAAKMLHPGESIEIRIKRLNVRNMPRLIADTGYIYELLVKMTDEREEAAQRGNN